MGSLSSRLRELLDRPQDPAGDAARVLLEALQNALDRRARDSLDPSGVQDLATAVGALLDGANRTSPKTSGLGASPHRPGTPMTRPVSSAQVDELRAVWREVTAGLFPGPADELPGEDVARWWGGVYALTLRLPVAERTRFRLRLERWAQGQGYGVGPGAQKKGAPAVDVVPSLADGDARALHDGLSLVPVPGTVAITHRTLAEVTSGLSDLALAVEELITLDSRLSHCLQRIEFLRVRSLNDPVHRETYRQELHNRKVALYSVAEGSPSWLEAAVDLHEAVCSVVHLPPAPEDSWWGLLRSEAHQLIAAAGQLSGNGVRIPADRYAMLGELTRPDQDIPLKVGGRGGRVLACVRVWSRAGGTDRPGRVIYGC